MSEIDQLRLQELIKYPELILEVGEWEVVAECLTCRQKLDPNSKLLQKSDEEIWRKYGRVAECPNCPAKGIFNPRVQGSDWGKFIPFPYRLVRRRLIVTKITNKRTWYGRRKVEKEGIWEEEELDRFEF